LGVFSGETRAWRERCAGASRGLALLAAVVLGGGCRSYAYRAASLPREVVAPGVVNMEAINLAGLSDSPENSQWIRCGDVLEVTMVTDFAKLTAATTPVRVADDGTASVPLIGKVEVVGMMMEGAERAIAAQGIARGIFRTPCVTVTMKQQRKNRVTVVGAVKKPGVYELPRGASSLLAALVAADGLSKEAGPELEVRRANESAGASGVERLALSAGRAGGAVERASHEDRPLGAAEPPMTVKVNLAEAGRQAQASYALGDGDVVYVAKRALKPVYVLGLVRKPGEFEFPGNQELRVLDALALAGGCSSQVADNVLVLRQLPGREAPARIAVSISAAKSGPENVVLAPGDTVVVEPTAATVVVDVLQNLFRFGFTSAIPMF